MRLLYFLISTILHWTDSDHEDAGWPIFIKGELNHPAKPRR